MRYTKKSTPSRKYGRVKSTIAENGREARIVGGSQAVAGDFPWIVSLQWNGNHICGGSIVSKNWIVSAAHCAKERNGKIRNKATLTIRAGMLLVDGGTVHRVIKIITRPEFSYETFDGDLSLMKVSPPFKFTKGVDGEGAIGPICLPLLDDSYEGTATVAGWGYHFSGADRVSDELMALDVNILKSRDCDNYEIFKASKMICAGYIEGKKDACQGDSGGPLTTINDQDTAVLIGVVSYGEGCAEPNMPGIYTDVSRHVEWIKNIVERQ